ncbi:MAG: type II toxin-antitoxin system RelE/ParE family toxin [Chania sp.]
MFQNGCIKCLLGYNEAYQRIQSGVPMIGSFRDGEPGILCRFYQHNERSGVIPTSIESQLRRKLSMLAAASTERSLFQPRSNNYERLSGNLEGWLSIRVNIQWRLIFRWRDGAAYDVYLDPHKY